MNDMFRKKTSANSTRKGKSTRTPTNLKRPRTPKTPRTPFGMYSNKRRHPDSTPTYSSAEEDAIQAANNYTSPINRPSCNSQSGKKLRYLDRDQDYEEIPSSLSDISEGGSYCSVNRKDRTWRPDARMGKFYF